jgi:hypothetical protein
MDQHINNKELNALVPSRCEAVSDLEPDLSLDLIEARRHISLCVDCRNKVRKYSLLVGRLPMLHAKPSPAGPECPQHVDWDEVAAGHWPAWKTKHTMMHAALCAHCGPLLRTAAQRTRGPSLPEEYLRAELKASSLPHAGERRNWRQPFWQSIKWWAPVAVALVIVGVLSTRPTETRTPISGAQFAELAVRTHHQHVRGEFLLDIHSDSQQAINDWLRRASPFSLVLPASPSVPDESRTYRPKGARLVRVGGEWADFIAYQIRDSESATTPSRLSVASLMVIPASVAKASGGVEAHFSKVTFHYATVDGYKVVTWSVHGLTYALVSDEGSTTQRSCMVCHSAMHDRDLSRTPSPLSVPDIGARPVWQ